LNDPFELPSLEEIEETRQISKDLIVIEDTLGNDYDNSDYDDDDNE
jgi:hypothetical protein